MIIVSELKTLNSKYVFMFDTLDLSLHFFDVFIVTSISWKIPLLLDYMHCCIVLDKMNYVFLHRARQCMLRRFPSIPMYWRKGIYYLC